MKPVVFIFSLFALRSTAAFHTHTTMGRTDAPANVHSPSDSSTILAETAADKESSSSSSSSSRQHEEEDTADDRITILGFGSLLSEKSSRLTFPNLTNFRLGRVPNYRRVFCHPASIFFQRGIADLDSLQISSLSVEYEEGHPGFVVSIYEVPNEGMMVNDIPSQAYLEREEEFDIIRVPFAELNENKVASSKTGIICARSTDEAYLKRWGVDRFNVNYKRFGLDTIWGWSKDSGIRPCAVYLRHCYLSAKSMGDVCLDSFLDETFLADRTTTIREYLETHPEILETEPPPELASRYGG